MRRALVILILLATAACSSDEMAARSPSDIGASCEEHISSVSLDVTPTTLTRGTTDPLTVTWVLDSNPSAAPRAHLSNSPTHEVELTVPLVRGASSTEWVATLTNPFGPGMPAGDVTVYVWLAVPTSCPQPPDATTTFLLQ